MWDGKDRLSLRQLLAIFFAALLSPLIRVMPGQTAAISGRGTWLASLLAIVPFCLLIWLLGVLLRHGNGRHLGELYCAIFGTVLGKVLSALYFLWLLLLMSVSVRDYSDRFLSTTYQDEVLAIFAAVLLLLVFVAARGTLRAFGRMGELCLGILLAVVIGSVLLAVSGLEIQPVLRVTLEDGRNALPSVPACLSMLGLSVYAGFLWPSVGLEAKGNGKKAVVWAVSFCVLLTVVQLAILGTLGTELTPHLQYPLFQMVKNSTAFGILERLESVVIALWVLSDYLFVGILAIAALALLKFLSGVKSTKALSAPILLLVFAGSLLIASSSFALEQFAQTVVQGGNLILGFGIPAAAVLVGKLRRVL